ncbi:phosphate ABC transporter permease subunit PstC [Clostridium hydrogenum]|uniref:phosphate ABC transporter permease subunit PstC n=1 Tax=Clostridium hydrogenum TaxID=2855764 RepID=UPI001F38E170|nr:phosphate ABC transporter permease subunit PstC [Clostridium hydrogenum]
MKSKSFFKKLKNEYIGKGFVTFCGILMVVLTLSIIFFVASKGIQVFAKDHYSLSHFLFSSNWDPDNKKFGALIFMRGSGIVSIGAVLISTPLAIALAVFMNIISPKLGQKILQPALELFVGIPSVVYGFVGVIFLIPLIRNKFGGVGFSVLAAILVLTIMILPTIASLSSDAIRNVHHDYIEASYGLGATRWQTIYKVIIPASKNGILTGIVLGLARAFGEALAVQMVIGNAIRFPKGLSDSTITLTGVITMDMANTGNGTPWNDALWALAFLLLIISFVFIVVIRLIGRKGEV